MSARRNASEAKMESLQRNTFDSFLKEVNPANGLILMMLLHGPRSRSAETLCASSYDAPMRTQLHCARRSSRGDRSDPSDAPIRRTGTLKMIGGDPPRESRVRYRPAPRRMPHWALSPQRASA